MAAQSADIEWVIADDGSTGDAATSYREIVRDVAHHVPVQFITLPQRSGLSRARNAALKNATGRWIVVLDSDDRLGRDLGGALIRLPDSIGLVAFEATYFNSAASEHRRIRYFEQLFYAHGGTILDPFLWFDFYYHGIIARKSVLCGIGGYLDELEVGEDQDILLRTVEALPREHVCFVHEIGYEYRKNPAGVCSQQWESVKSNYTATMLAAAKRRGANFHDCRFAGVKEVDGSWVDQYEYRSTKGEWLTWDSMVIEGRAA